ncbi:hypothetical protein BVC80_6663g3 [Macleaya cordata]|uniref:Endonuclease/exonuclease/phosphatase domain-containing protein n=1 Tax=Macleaya cordata TaxID=56857 RepID=A0A200QWJ7_MACCD|nr:hypothetical protein BVC80_6663g3 [Macleaya cordata]
MWDDLKLELKDELITTHSLSLLFRNRVDDFEWGFTYVYSPIEYSKKVSFWAELDVARNWKQVPWVVAGDFNATLDKAERNRRGRGGGGGWGQEEI